MLLNNQDIVFLLWVYDAVTLSFWISEACTRMYVILRGGEITETALAILANGLENSLANISPIIFFFRYYMTRQHNTRVQSHLLIEPVLEPA